MEIKQLNATLIRHLTQVDRNENETYHQCVSRLLNTYKECLSNFDFCKYGLKISPPNVNKIDPRNRGSFVHSCLEGILSKTLPDGSVVYDEDFKSLSDDKLKEKIHDYFKQYVALELGGDFGKTKRFDFISKRWEESAFYVVKNLRDELINTLL